MNKACAAVISAAILGLVVCTQAEKDLLCQGRGLSQSRAQVLEESFDLTDNNFASLWACGDPKDKESLHCMYSGQHSCL